MLINYDTQPSVLLGAEELLEIRDKAQQFRNKLSSLKIAVICGGDSKEREVSLASGKKVLEAMLMNGLNAELVDLNYDTLQSTLPGSFSAGFLTLHGGKGEDGTIQGYLDAISFPYVGAGVQASVIGMNKALFKSLVNALGLNTPAFIHIIGKETNLESITEFAELGAKKFVVKPAKEGSSIGVHIVDRDNLLKVARANLETYSEIIVEEFIEGKEVTVAVLGTRQKPIVLPLVEIAPKREPFYDYKAKYTTGETDYIIPARINPETQEKLALNSSVIYRFIDFSPYVRFDTMINNDGTHYFLEANTLPGFTDISLFPQASASVGISYGELIIILLYLALAD